MIKTNNRLSSNIIWLIPLVLLNLILIAPEALRERIFPYDGALFAANGAFFLSIFEDLANVISSPVSWIWNYYHQYPALFIRRHPPILGLAESAMFAMFGISAVTAKLTILIFSSLWVIGWFVALRKMFKEEFIAFFSTLLILTLPMSVSLGSSVRADIPSMMFFAWGCYFYACYLDSSTERQKYAISAAILLSCSLYTYQLPMFGVIALFLHILIVDWKNLFKRSDFYTLSILFILLMFPLILFTLKFASDNIGGVVGEVNKDFLPFVPARSTLSMENWSYYLKIMWQHYTMPTIGLVIWGATKIKVRLQRYELFFVLWILIGYFGFSIIPSKGPRYAYHFVIAALPLTVIGIRDSLKLLVHGWGAENLLRTCTAILILIMVFWNISGISQAMSPYVQGVDKAARLILAEDKSAKILYHGAFESAFIFYVRKFDVERKARVLRTANELSNSKALANDINTHEIDYIVVEAENLRKGAYGGIYDEFWYGILDLTREETKFRHLADIKVRWGKPKQEKDMYLKIFKVLR